MDGIYAIVAQTATDLFSPENSPSVSMWPYLLASAQTEKLRIISIYGERGSSREQVRVLYMNASAIDLWRQMGHKPTIIGFRHRPPQSAQLTFGMPFSE